MPNITHGTIAAGHSLTAQAGIEMLQQGGNAFDAALAAMLATCVAEPSTTSAASGGFLLAHTAKGQHKLYDFFVQTPQNKNLNSVPDFFPVTLNFGAASQTFHIGLASAAVPGFFAGFFHIYEQLGTLPLDVIAAPAIRFARQGVEIIPFQHHAFNLLKPIITHSSTGKELFINKTTGQIANIGESLRMPLLADTLEHIMREGKRAFYEGEIAQRIAKDCKENGGFITLEDLKNFQVIEREALRHTYRGKQLLTNPPPSSGGILIAFTLALLEKVNLGNMTFGSAEHIELLTKALQQCSLARNKALNGHQYDESITDRFLSDAFLNHFQLNSPNKWGCTTHLSVLDEKGNAASVTTSHGEGCGYYIPGTQIMMNNMLGEEDLMPNGFHTWAENVRFSSMMSPTILLDEGGKAQIVTGTGGANRIRTAILQVLNNIIDFKMPLAEAVKAPRIHWEEETLYLEPGFEKQVYQLQNLGKIVSWDTLNMFFGGAHTVGIPVQGMLTGTGDSRREGATLSC